MDASQFRRLNNLGEGVDTIVYRGYDGNLQRYVAIKELKESQRSDPRRVEQFFREASFLAGVKHDNVLQIYSADRANGRLVMELMQGTLADLVKSNAMKPDLVRSVLRQLLSALEFLHGQGRIHGNIRPSNLLIDEYGRVKLSDFEGTQVDGELRVPKNHTKYVAPELLNREFGDLSPALDIYSAGFTTLELLMGSKFDSTLIPGGHVGDPMAAWLRWHGSPEAYRPVNEYVPRIPNDLADVLDRMLCKRVADRPASAAAVIRLLDDVPLLSVPTPKQNESNDSPVLQTSPPPPAPPIPIGPDPNQTNAYPPPGQSEKKKRPLTEAEKKQKSKNLTNVLAGILTFLVIFVGGMMVLPNSKSERLELSFNPKTVEVQQVTIEAANKEGEEELEAQTLTAEEDRLEVEDGVLEVRLEEALLESESIQIRLSVVGFKEAVINIDPSKQDFDKAVAVELQRKELLLNAGEIDLKSAKVTLNGTVLKLIDPSSSVDSPQAVTVAAEDATIETQAAADAVNTGSQWKMPTDLELTEKDNLLLVELAGYLTSELKPTAEQLTAGAPLRLVLARPKLRIRLDQEGLDGSPIKIQLGDQELTGSHSAADPGLYEFTLPQEFFASGQMSALIQLAGFLPWEKNLTIADLTADKPLSVELQQVPVTNNQVNNQLVLVLTPAGTTPGSVLWNGKSVKVDAAPDGSFVLPFASVDQLGLVNQLDIVVDGFRPWRGRVRQAQILNAIPVDVPLERQVAGQPLRVALLVSPGSLESATLTVDGKSTELATGEDPSGIQHIIEVAEASPDKKIVFSISSEGFQTVQIERAYGDLRESPLLVVDLKALNGMPIGTEPVVPPALLSLLTEGMQYLDRATVEFDKRNPQADQLATEFLFEARTRFEQIVMSEDTLNGLLDKFPQGSEAVIGLASTDRMLRTIGLRSNGGIEQLEEFRRSGEIETWNELATVALTRVEGLLAIDGENEAWLSFAIDTAKECRLYEQQIEHLDTYLELQPGDHARRYDRVVAWFKLDRGQLSNERWERIENEARLCLEADSEVAGYHRLLGESLRSLSQWEESIEAYDRSLELDKESVIGKYGLLVALRGRFEELLERFSSNPSPGLSRQLADVQRRIISVGTPLSENHPDSQLRPHIKAIVEEVEDITF